MNDEPELSDEPLPDEAKKPVEIGFIYLALLLIAGLGVLLIGGRIIRVWP